LSILRTFHYTTGTQIRDYKQKKSPAGQPPGIRNQIPMHLHNRQTSSHASNTCAKMSITSQCHSKTRIIPWKLKKQLQSITTHQHPASQQKQNSPQKRLHICFETMFRFETMESTAEPIQSNQQEISYGNQQ
jgi:hypothetical protein